MAESRETERTSTSTTTHTVHEKPKTDLFSNILAIVGLIILVVIIIWGLLNLATLTGPWLSSLFSHAPVLQVTAPSSATSGTPFTISWKYSTSEKGTYAFLYPCRGGLQFEIGAGVAAPCGVAFGVPSTNNSVSVMPRLSATSSLDVPLSIIFIPSATTSKQVQGSAVVKINPGAASAQPAQPTKPATPAPAPAPRGPADLSVSIISASTDQWGNATAVFDVANIGGSASGSYFFTAQLPTASAYIYASPPQASLGVGDHIVNTLRFSQAAQNGIFSVSVDSSNAVAESNKGNNFASRNISGAVYNNYNQAPYNYSQPYPQPYYTNQPYQYQQLYPYYTY